MPSKSNQPNIQAYEKKNINKMNKIYLKKKKNREARILGRSNQHSYFLLTKPIEQFIQIKKSQEEKHKCMQIPNIFTNVSLESNQFKSCL